jgi:cyclase
MRTFLTATFAALLVVPAFGQAPGRGGGQPVQPIQQVKPGLFVVAGAGATSIVRVTSDGVILVDGKLPGEENYKALMDQIKSVTDKPVKFMIVTHHHADHTGNNDRFIAAGAQVIGHEQLARNLDTYKFDPLPAKPTKTYTKDYTVKLGGAQVRVLHLGSAHTGGDSVVYFPDVKVVATSDLVTVGAGGPLIDYAGGGTAAGFLTALDAMLKLDFDTAVPGAGEVQTKADIGTFRTKFGAVIDRARELVKKGVPKEELLKQIKTDDIGWAPRIPMVDAFYNELSRGAR